jgi:hypothetical protein
VFWSFSNVSKICVLSSLIEIISLISTPII